MVVRVINTSQMPWTRLLVRPTVFRRISMVRRTADGAK
jgi:hypothetical protein